MVALTPISEDEHRRWFTPIEALLALNPMSADAAGMLLQDGARTEEIRTSAKAFYCEPTDLPGFSMGGYAQIPAYYWAHLSRQQSKSSDFWQTGSLRAWFGTTPYFRLPTAVRCMDVRFNREDVERAKPPVPRQLLVEALNKTNAPPIQASTPCPEPDQKGPPVSKAALATWFEAYKLAFAGPEETEARALESARGCFPGKSISRDAVRALRGGQKRGPKPKPAK